MAPLVVQERGVAHVRVGRKVAVQLLVAELGAEPDSGHLEVPDDVERTARRAAVVRWPRLRSGVEDEKIAAGEVPKSTFGRGRVAVACRGRSAPRPVRKRRPRGLPALRASLPRRRHGPTLTRPPTVCSSTLSKYSTGSTSPPPAAANGRPDRATSDGTSGSSASNRCCTPTLPAGEPWRTPRFGCASGQAWTRASPMLSSRCVPPNPVDSSTTMASCRSQYLSRQTATAKPASPALSRPSKKCRACSHPLSPRAPQRTNDSPNSRVNLNECREATSGRRPNAQCARYSEQGVRHSVREASSTRRLRTCLCCSASG
jgi:hypothetical protein